MKGSSCVRPQKEKKYKHIEHVAACCAVLFILPLPFRFSCEVEHEVAAVCDLFQYAMSAEAFFISGEARRLHYKH